MSAAPASFRAGLSHSCLRGLGEVAAALGAGDLATVCRTFETWQAEARRPWPWLPGLCWKALEPLGVTFPAGDADAVLAGRLLVGAECDAAAVAPAVDALRRLPEPATEEAEPTQADADPVAAMRRQRLASAVEAFWRDYVAAARELSAPVRAGDRARADAVVTATRRRLEESAERIDALAAAVAAAGAGVVEPPAGEPALLPRGEAAPPREPAVPAGRAAAGQRTERLAPLAAPQRARRRPAAAAPPAGRVPSKVPAAGLTAAARGTPAPAPRSRRPEDPDVEYVRVSEHRYAPVVFLVGVSLAAIAWLAIIAASGG